MRDLEAREYWIESRIDELLCDNLWCIEMSEKFSKSWIADFDEYMKISAKRQAEKEHAAIMADLEEAIIDSMELK